MNGWPDQLYRLLPAVHQIRDGEQGEMLRAWLQIIGEQVRDVQNDIDQLYDNWFIETCDDWVVPYLGDLVGFRNVDNAGEPSDAATAQGRMLNRFLFPRREIANLVRRRRRKGTLSVIEDVARDVAGWRSRAVEFSRLSNFFQNVRHPLPEMGTTLEVRDRDVTSRVQTPFDRAAHTLDVRAIRPWLGVGWYHPKKVGLFVWRRKVYSASRMCPYRVCENTECQQVSYYTFSRLGQEVPLYVRPVDETNELSIAEESNLPVPLTRDLLQQPEDDCELIEGLEKLQTWIGARRTGASGEFYGLTGIIPRSLAIEVKWTSSSDVVLIPACDIVVCCLADCHLRRRLFNELEPRQVAVDPELGLFMFSPQSTPPDDIRVSYHYSMAGEIGGGEYERQIILDSQSTTIRLRAEGSCESREKKTLFQAAFDKLNSLGDGRMNRCSCGTSSAAQSELLFPSKRADDSGDRWVVTGNLCIELVGSGNFLIDALEHVQVKADATLEIRAANGSWPYLQVLPGDSEWEIQVESNSRLILDGVFIAGATIKVVEGTESPPESKPEIIIGCPPCPPDHDAPPGTDTHCADFVNQTRVPRLDIRHTTFVPGGRVDHSLCDHSVSRASIKTELSTAAIRIRHSIIGTLSIEQRDCEKKHAEPHQPATCPIDPISIDVRDSILDAARGLPAIYANCCHPAHAELIVERSTVLGDLCVQQISRAQDAIFAGLVHVKRRGVGYLRFCYLPRAQGEIPVMPYGADQCSLKSKACAVAGVGWDIVRGKAPTQSTADWCFSVRTPQRFKCVPETIVNPDSRSCSSGCGETASPAGQPNSKVLQPQFVSVDYGTPGYCQLALDCPREILRGAEDESELGAFHDLYQPQRMTALEARLQEYTPADMQSAVIYADDLAWFEFSRMTH